MASQQWQCDGNQTLTQQFENITLCDDSQQQQSSNNALNANQNVNTRNDIEIIRSQPNTSINMAKTFEELKLPEQLLKGLNDMGFSAPTELQQKVLPLLLATPPTNLIVQSHYRTGKTVAFVLASLCRIKTEFNYPQVMIVLPTYESVIQTGEVVQRMAKYVPEIKFRFAIKGKTVARGSRVSEHIIIGTPGKLIKWALLFFDLKRIKMFVGNEADIFKHIYEYRQEIIRIRERLSPDCQMIYVSGTYESYDNFNLITRNSVIIRHKYDEKILDNFNQYYVKCYDESEKYKSLANIFETISIGQAFVFCQNQSSVDYLKANLNSSEHISFEYISDMFYDMLDLDLDRTKQMTERLIRFRDQQKRLLIIVDNVWAISTHDIDASFVVNYDLPINTKTNRVDKNTYFRRISRLGRFGEKGVVINFVDSVKTVSMVKELEKHFGCKISILDATDKTEIEKINQI